MTITLSNILFVYVFLSNGADMGGFLLGIAFYVFIPAGYISFLGFLLGVGFGYMSSFWLVYGLDIL